MRGRSDSPLIDRVARGAAAGMTRREILRVGAGAIAAAALPAAAWPTAAPAAKQRGTCSSVPRGTCPPGTTAKRWSRGATRTIPSGTPSTFNGCGPESGFELPVFGRSDPVPDEPLLLASFFDGCKAHDCCYGTCGSDQEACDRAFLAKSVTACVKEHPGDGIVSTGLLMSCLNVAQSYYVAVSSGGRSAWEAAQETACLACEPNRCRPGYEECGDDCCKSGFCLDGRCVSDCGGTPCPDGQDCCFGTRESPGKPVCCPPSTTCRYDLSGYASCKPI
ncbi:hypothetical protein Q5424_15575 [Conexibacter sp. JD483]|uniref:hypothetical protein n=1 Tax=unclassified Conexibacter TaxID=2627773 RepID=UPI0027270105|nr:MULTISPECIES: hypothetical protein [unclassified Conexibacter]MDO8185283.1 hypothetical protein [Conexibacter sp. CPCC 205706]MDO8198329.1 hypothetical protein [Conexibacter sp. CPCC 205762]MDR9370516.1 hypothetical protein [Conexibacter sp. JD483]